MSEERGGGGPTEDGGGEETRQWLMFLVRPADLLHLFQIMADSAGDAEEGGEPTIVAPRFPPDLRVHDAFYLAERDFFGMVLESQFFEPVVVTRNREDGPWSGAWNELIFDLNIVDDEDEVPTDGLWAELTPEDAVAARSGDGLPGPTVPPIGPDDEKRWCAFFVKPAQVIGVLQMLAEGHAFRARVFPPDARLVFGSYDDAREAFGLILQSEDFDAVTAERQGDSVRLALPERFLDIQRADGRGGA